MQSSIAPHATSQPEKLIPKLFILLRPQDAFISFNFRGDIHQDEIANYQFEI